MKKIIIFVTLFIIFFQINFSEAQSRCGDGVIDVGLGEACDPNLDNLSNTNYEGYTREGCEDDEVCEPDELPQKEGEQGQIEDCSDLGNIPPDVLGCYGLGDNVREELRCQLDVRKCQFGFECKTCDDCGSGPTEKCEHSLCINFCPDKGSCHYIPYERGGLGNCKDCSEIISCNLYTNEIDCNGDVCNLLPRDLDDCVGKCPNDPNIECTDDIPCGQDNYCDFEGLLDCRIKDEKGAGCLWIDGECQPNWDCQWDCDGIYDKCINGIQKKIKDNCIYIGEENKRDGCFDPGPGYPDEITCNIYDRKFPVFSPFNIFLSLFLLASFYILVMIKKKKK